MPILPPPLILFQGLESLGFFNSVWHGSSSCLAGSHLYPFFLPDNILASRSVLDSPLLY